MTDFRSYSELYHFGVKGMKWHRHKLKGPEDEDPISSLKKEAERLQEKGNDLQDKASKGDYKGLYDAYKTDSESRAIINGYVSGQVDSIAEKNLSEKNYKMYKSLRKSLRKGLRKQVKAYHEKKVEYEKTHTKSSGGHRI